MNEEVNLILEKLKIVATEEHPGMYLCDKEHSRMLVDYITNLEQEKDKFKLRCFKALRLIRDNYGVLDKYGLDLLDDILNGDE